jgi:hypothetical protein
VHSGSITASAPGRVLTMYGHRHSNATRFSAWRTRGADRELVYEDYDWLEPTVLEFNSLTTNNPPNPTSYVAGGHSGVLDLQAGDKLEWECHVVNERDNVLRFSNNTYTGEMCIMDAELVGTNCSAGFALPGQF